MPEMFFERRSGTPRILFQKFIRIILPERERGIWVQAANLSESGMFISSSELYPVGAEVLCYVPLLEEDRDLTLRGKVTWKRTQPVPGMGIKFLDVSDGEISILRQVVIGKQTMDPISFPVKVWFEGLPQPIRAQAVHNDNGISIQTELPFLRLNSRVVVSKVEQEGCSESGILEHADLRTDANHPNPWLQLNIRLNQSYNMPNWTFSSWSNPAEVLEVEDPISKTDGSADGTSIIIEPAIPGEENFAEDLVQPKETSTEKEILSNGDPINLAQMSTLTELPNQLLALERENVEESCLASENINKRMHFKHVGLWLVAWLMVGITLASLAYTRAGTRLWNYITDNIGRALAFIDHREKDTRLPTSHSSSKAIISSSGVSSKLIDVKSSQPQHALKEHSALKQYIKVDKDKSATKLAVSLPPHLPEAMPKAAHESLSISPIDLKEVGGQIKISFPYRGSSAGGTFYPLTNPNAIAINLPRASTQINFGDYAIHKSGIKMIWVRKRKVGGIHFRIFLKGEIPQYQVVFDKNAVDVNLN